MNIKHVLNLLLGLFFCLLFQACNNDDNSIVYTSPTKDAQIYSFSFTAIAPISADSVKRAQDSIRFIQVNKTQYAIDQISGIIYNPDSLPYGTILKKVEAKLTLTQVGVSQVEVFTPDSVNGFKWNKTDSLDFSKRPIKFVITSIGGDNKKTYDLDIRIHKIDPDTLVWTKMSDLPVKGNSKTLLNNNTFYTYISNNGSVSLYTSDKVDNLTWQKQTLSGMPSDIQIYSLLVKDGNFFAISNNGKAYKSLDGKTWIEQNNGKKLTSVLGLLPVGNTGNQSVILSVIDKNGKYYFGKSEDLASVEEVSEVSINPLNNQIPADLPYKYAASFSNFSSDKFKRMLILVGGSDTNDTRTNATWLIKNSSSALEITPFKKNTFSFETGASAFYYDNHLYLLSKNKFFISNFWGESWIQAPQKQKLIPAISERTFQSVIVDDKNYIWIFGGVSENGSYPTDVWRGRLNRLNP